MPTVTRTLDRLFDRLPTGLQRVTRRGYYLAHPRLAWSARRRAERVDEAFVDRFFEDEEEFDTYRQEFFDGPITDVCRRAVGQVPDDVVVYDAHREVCAKLYSLVRKRTPTTLVETGVYSGVSTLSLLLALEENDIGTLHSVDFSDQLADSRSSRERFYARGRPSCADPGSAALPASKEPGWIVPDELDHRWELTRGRSQRALVTDVLPHIDEIDLFLHDSEHSTTCMLFEFELAWEWLAEGGLVLSSHVGRNDAFETFSAEHACESGLFDYVYDVGYTNYSEPCSSGYVVKP